METRHFIGKLYLSVLIFLVLLNFTVADSRSHVPARVLAKQTGATQFEEERYEAHADCNEHKHHLKKRASDEDVDYEVYQGVVGRPGIDFPIYPRIPKTTFSCRSYGNGYFADMETDCQVFHICEEGRKISFLCPNGTIFQQSELTCDWWFKVNCLGSSGFYADSTELLNKQRVERLKPSIPVQGFNIVGGGLNIKPRVPAKTTPRSRGGNVDVASSKSERRIDSAEAPSLESMDFDDLSGEKQIKGSTKTEITTIDNNDNDELQIPAESASFVTNRNRNSYNNDKPKLEHKVDQVSKAGSVKTDDGSRRGSGDRGSQRRGYGGLNAETTEKPRSGQRGNQRYREDKKHEGDAKSRTNSEERPFKKEKLIENVDKTGHSTPSYVSGTYSTARRLDSTRTTPFYTPTVPSIVKSKTADGKSSNVGSKGGSPTTPAAPHRFNIGNNKPGIFLESSGSGKSTVSPSDVGITSPTTVKPIIIGMRRHNKENNDHSSEFQSGRSNSNLEFTLPSNHKNYEGDDILATTPAPTGPTYLPKSASKPISTQEASGESFLFAPITVAQEEVNRNVHDMIKTMNVLQNNFDDVELVKFNENENGNGNTRLGLEIPPSSGPDALFSLAKYFATEDPDSASKNVNSLGGNNNGKKSETKTGYSSGGNGSGGSGGNGGVNGSGGKTSGDKGSGGNASGGKGSGSNGSRGNGSGGSGSGGYGSGGNGSGDGGSGAGGKVAGGNGFEGGNGVGSNGSGGNGSGANSSAGSGAGVNGHAGSTSNGSRGNGSGGSGSSGNGSGGKSSGGSSTASNELGSKNAGGSGSVGTHSTNSKAPKEKPSDTTATLTTETPAALAHNSDHISSSLLSNNTVTKYNTLFGLNSPTASDAEANHRNGLADPNAPKSKDINTPFPQIGATDATIQALAEKPESRKIAQVFSNALNDYLNDPVKFRDELVSVRPTEPPVDKKSNFVSVTDPTLFNHGTAATYLPTAPPATSRPISSTHANIASVINANLITSTGYPDYSSTTEVLDATTFRQSSGEQKHSLEFSGELEAPGADSGEELLQREHTQSFVNSRNGLLRTQDKSGKLTTGKPDKPWSFTEDDGILDPLKINDGLMKKHQSTTTTKSTTTSPISFLTGETTTNVPKNPVQSHSSNSNDYKSKGNSNSKQQGVTKQHNDRYRAETDDPWADIFDSYDLPRESLPTNSGLQRIANKLFGGLNENEASHLKNVMAEAEHNRQILRLLLLLIQTCDDNNGKALERSRKSLLNALISMDSKVTKDSGKNSHVKEKPLTTTEKLPVTTYRRTGSGEEITTSTLTYPSTTTDVASTTVYGSTTDANNSGETTKFAIIVDDEEPSSTTSATASAGSGGQLDGNSDKRALELLKSLYSLASKFTSRR